MVKYFEIADHSLATFQMAMSIAVKHKLQIWDSLVLAIASEQKCRILLTEDMQHGFSWNGATVINPFHAPKHKLLQIAEGDQA